MRLVSSTVMIPKNQRGRGRCQNRRTRTFLLSTRCRLSRPVEILVGRVKILKIGLRPLLGGRRFRGPRGSIRSGTQSRSWRWRRPRTGARLTQTKFGPRKSLGRKVLRREPRPLLRRFWRVQIRIILVTGRLIPTPFGCRRFRSSVTVGPIVMGRFGSWRPVTRRFVWRRSGRMRRSVLLRRRRRRMTR